MILNIIFYFYSFDKNYKVREIQTAAREHKQGQQDRSKDDGNVTHTAIVYMKHRSRSRCLL